MVTIRLTRRGARNSPYYHVVVTDHHRAGPQLPLTPRPTPRRNGERLLLVTTCEEASLGVAGCGRHAS